MKVSEFKRLATQAGCSFLRHGSRHDIWVNPKGEKFSIPRHDVEEMPKGLAKSGKEWAGVK